MQYNPTVRFSKFTSNKEYEEFERFLTKLVWRETWLMGTLKAFINSSFQEINNFLLQIWL